MSASVYEVFDYPGFQALLEKGMREINVSYASNLRDAARTGNLSLLVQVGANCEAECIETKPLGELLGSKVNEHGEQFIDARAAEKVLFGKFGILKPGSGQPRKLALPIQVTWVKGKYDPLPHSPTISSGRHRVLSLWVLLLAAGLTEAEARDTPIRITSLVAPSNEDFAMVMEANNQSRTQSSHELDVHQLTGLGVQTNDADAFYEGLPNVAVRRSMHAKLFAQAVRLSYGGKLGASTVYKAAKAAWCDLKGVDRENANALAVRGFQPEDPSTLRRHANYLAGEMDRCYGAAIRAAEQPTDITRIFKENVAREVAAVFEVSAPVYPTQQEVMQARLETAQAKAEALKAQLTSA